MKDEARLSKHAIRLLKLLSRFRQSGIGFYTENTSCILSVKNREYRFDLSLIGRLKSASAIAEKSGALKLTDHGMLVLKKHLNPDLDRGLQTRNVKSLTVQVGEEKTRVSMNIDESPLSRLYFRKTGSGEGYINNHEFMAGERLRKDFECGQLQPHISANWKGLAGMSGGSSVKGGAVDVSDFAMDARKRVNRVVEFLGPDLSGVTLDICCFLKGIELIERERRWPPRSAKLMLKTALALLARHYGIVTNRTGKDKGLRSWGAQDYRPGI